MRLAYILYPLATRGRTIQQLSIQLRQEFQRYVALHEGLFGTNFIPFLFPRPSPEVLFKIKGSFADFLIRNNLPLMNTLVYALFTRTGYGQPNRLGAVYGLSFLTPRVVRNLLLDGNPRTTLIDTGLVDVLETLVKRFQIDIKLNADIQKIVRHKNHPKGKVEITYGIGQNKNAHVSYFDFLVVAVPMKNLFGVIDLSPPERVIFGQQFTDTYFISTLCDGPFGERTESPVEIFLEKLFQYDYEPFLARDYYAEYNNITGPTYKQGLIRGGLDGASIQTTQYLQLGRIDPRIPAVAKDVEQKLDTFLGSKKRTPYRIIQKFVTPYFTRFPIPALDKGILWDVLDLQGTHNTWYIGGSVTIDAAGAVMQYNDKLLRSYVPPLSPG